MARIYLIHLVGVIIFSSVLSTYGGEFGLDGNEYEESQSYPSEDESALYLLLNKRQAPPAGFENIERNYLISQSLKYLQEFIGFAIKANNDTETRAYMEQVLQQETRKVHAMSTDDLKIYVANIHHALQNHHAESDDIVISGHTYSMDHISDWCCNFGG